MALTAPTRQVIDPAGILGSYPTAVTLTAVALAAGAAGSTGSIIGGGSAGLEAIALALFTIACSIVIGSARPARAPFTARSHFLVHLFALAAFGSSTAATWGSGGSFLQQNWAAVGLGILIIAVAPYRPVPELLAGGSITAVFVAAVTIIEAELSVPSIPAISLAVGPATAVLALCYGNATYSASTIRSLRRSTTRADVASDALATELRDQVARSVQDDRATILARDVVPFLTDLLARADLTEADRGRAREIAESIRAVMVTEADRTWLDTFLAPTAYSAHRSVVFDDPSHLAPEMSTRQRTAMRALLVAVGEDPRATDIAIDLVPSRAVAIGSIRVAVEHPDAARARYAPYFAVMRVAFASSSVDLDHSALTVRFTFDRD